MCAGVSGFGVVDVLDDASEGQGVGVILYSILSRSGGLPWLFFLCVRERYKSCALFQA